MNNSFLPSFYLCVCTDKTFNIFATLRDCNFVAALQILIMLCYRLPMDQVTKHFIEKCPTCFLLTAPRNRFNTRDSITFNGCTFYLQVYLANQLNFITRVDLRTSDILSPVTWCKKTWCQRVQCLETHAKFSIIHVRVLTTSRTSKNNKSNQSLVLGTQGFFGLKLLLQNHSQAQH